MELSTASLRVGAAAALVGPPSRPCGGLATGAQPLLVLTARVDLAFVPVLAAGVLVVCADALRRGAVVAERSPYGGMTRRHND